MLERSTERARRVIAFAAEEARLLRHNYIGTEHILLGLLLEDEGLAARVLESMGITVERVRAQVIVRVGQGKEDAPSAVAFTPNAKQVIERALREALALGHNNIDTQHVLLALAAVEGVGSRVLLDLGADAVTVRDETLRMTGPDPSSYRPPTRDARPTPTHAPEQSTMPAGDGIPRLFGIAADVAGVDGRGVIETRDVLLAMTRDPQTAPLLAKLGVDEAALRAALKQADDAET